MCANARTSSSRGESMQPTTLTEPPDDPMGIFGKMHFITTIGAGIMLARNWKKLGKPDWVGTATMLVLAATVGSMVLMVGALIVLSNLHLLSGSVIIIVFLAFGSNIGSVIAQV